ncbi:S41 family peptidase [Maricaulis sp.]|uniref:S41 family peptidase n=1 Tax=Maricaulis sp. TaxID=1486257 RepID=UPI0025C5A7E9|nr:S41 family peptidase [Maricaulis sp.]
MTKVHSWFAALVLACLPACASAEPAALPAEALIEDVTDWQDWLFATHPQPEFSMDVATVDAAFHALRERLDGRYTRREAWLELATLNPLFADGHVTLRLPQADYEAWLVDGGPAFTLPVRIIGNRLIVGTIVDPASALAAGSEITHINGQPAGAILAAALARANGDTPGLRAHVVETRFPRFLWALTGGAEAWQLDVIRPDGSIASHQLDPASDRAGTAPQPWSLDFMHIDAAQGEAAILTLNTFMPTLESGFAAFIDASFAEIDARGAAILIIDISENGGGAHQLSDHLLAYLTDQRHTPISAVTARITPENQPLVPGARIGEILSLPFAQWVEPPASLDHRFTGRVAFLVGAGTYSQAIVLATTAQDFNIAPVAGPGTEGRANSTGQVQFHTLAHSGLEVAAPIYVFTRASGDTSSAPVVPDIPLSGPREAQISALIAHLLADD